MTVMEPNKQPQSRSSRRSSATMAILALVLVATVGLYFRSRSASSYTSAGTASSRRQYLVGILAGGEQQLVTADDADDDNVKLQSSDGGPTLTVEDVDELIESLGEARLRFDRRMMTDYGEHHRTISSAINLTYAYASEESRERLIRRIMIKLLEASSSSSSTRDDRDDPATNAATFTWATGGHSSAAGHGNLYNQSYTAVMERYAADAFSSVDLHLVGRNHAMGGMSSGPELSMCMEEVYGPDVDVLSWDFGMTDGRNYDKLHLWCARASLHPSRPILVLRGDGRRRDRWDRFRNAAARLNMGAVVIDPNPVFNALREVLPDAVKDGEDGQGNLTEPLRYLMCNGGMENGDPCRNYKYSTAPCTKVIYQAKWHPGWKEHMLQGILMASFLIDALDESLVELRRRLSSSRRHASTNATTTADSGDGGDDAPPSAVEVLNSLLDDERRDAREVSLDYSATESNLLHPAGADNITDALAQRRSFCRTGLLPSQSRFDGVVKGSGPGSVGDVYNGGYDLATPRDKLDDVMDVPVDHRRHTYDDPMPIRLVSIPGKHDDCVVPTFVDEKDAFLVREVDGWVSMTVPSDEEVAWAKSLTTTLGHIGGGDDDERDEGEREGIIMICLRPCAWGKCPKEHITFEEFVGEEEGSSSSSPSVVSDGASEAIEAGVGGNDGGSGSNITIHVDGDPVVGVVDFNGCHLLEGPDGLRWGGGRRGRNDGGDGDGRAGAGGGVDRFELKFRANRPGGELRFTSVVVL